MSLKLPPSVRNWVSLTGAVIVLITFFMIAFLFVVTLFQTGQAAYLGLVTYILLPSVMIIGLLLIPIGMLLEIRREHREGTIAEPGWPRIDLNIPHYRHAFFIFSVGTAFFLFISAIGSYEAFHYTESVSFCGTLCHQVMNPEYTAHANSPHAKVPCVDCHVGPGAGWYVRSKLSGLYQVYAVTTNVYPRPIPTPIENLRPARAVCEQCHWPEKFYGHIIQTKTHYLPDKDNTPWKIRLSLKIGPPEAALGLVEGIHWHINPKVKVEYIATDDRRQKIPWVRVTYLDTGKVKVFEDKNNPLSPAQVQNADIRTMDCIDCHNRPSHWYRAPSLFVNTAMTAGEIPPELPEIKSEAVKLAAAKYASQADANRKIEKELTDFYQKSYPDVFKNHRDWVKKAVTGLQGAFDRNIFPVMKVRWSAYPDNTGHLEFPGCFRCHNGNHETNSGETISRSCNLCHHIDTQGTPGKNLEVARVGDSLKFKHPVDIGGAWQEMMCSDCHSGTTP